MLPCGPELRRVVQEARIGRSPQPLPRGQNPAVAEQRQNGGSRTAASPPARRSAPPRRDDLPHGGDGCTRRWMILRPPVVFPAITSGLRSTPTRSIRSPQVIRAEALALKSGSCSESRVGRPSTPIRGQVDDVPRLQRVEGRQPARVRSIPTDGAGVGAIRARSPTGGRDQQVVGVADLVEGGQVGADRDNRVRTSCRPRSPSHLRTSRPRIGVGVDILPVEERAGIGHDRQPETCSIAARSGCRARPPTITPFPGSSRSARRSRRSRSVAGPITVPCGRWCPRNRLACTVWGCGAGRPGCSGPGPIPGAGAGSGRAASPG